MIFESQGMFNGDYKKALPYYNDFVVPGFAKAYPIGIFKCLSFSDRTTEQWFNTFVVKIKDSIGKTFLPIFRMSDGEYQFCVGYRYPRRQIDEPLWRFIIRTVWRLVNRFKAKVFTDRLVGGGAGYISTNYTKSELKSLRITYAEQLKRISNQGIMALHFTDRIKAPCKKQFQQQYITPMLKWLNENNIVINEKNYFPFYFVYALLRGDCRRQLYESRRILVITSYDQTKREAIERGLKSEGVADVQFIPLSVGRSMYDTIDLFNIKKPIDIVLVGGGVGASNILCQLESLNTVAIDAGYVIECLANPELKKQRTFCWPDEERQGNYDPI